MSTQERDKSGQCEESSPPLFTVNLFPCRPVLGEIVDLALNLVLQYSVSVETDEETEASTVVVEECRSDRHSISLSVLGRSGAHISAEWGCQRSWDSSSQPYSLPGREQNMVKKRSDPGVKLALPLICGFGVNLALGAPVFISLN